MSGNDESDRCAVIVIPILVTQQPQWSAAGFLDTYIALVRTTVTKTINTVVLVVVL